MNVGPGEFHNPNRYRRERITIDRGSDDTRRMFFRSFGWRRWASLLLAVGSIAALIVLGWSGAVGRCL